jgi:hypothetical protein
MQSPVFQLAFCTSCRPPAQTVQFPAGDAPAWYMLAAGTTQEIFAATGCIAAVDAYTTIQSIDVEML